MNLVELAMLIDLSNLNDWVSTEDCASCIDYIKLNEEWGIKFYRNEEIRNECFYNQRDAYPHGIAPDSHCMLDFEEDGLYAYITEHVDTGNYLTDEDFESLKEEAENLNIATDDLDPNRNVGYLNGNPVIIDFDPITMRTY